jgi:hypothetical protein
MRTGETGHVNAVGTLDEGDDTVGGGGAREEGHGKELGGMHLGLTIGERCVS